MPEEPSRERQSHSPETFRSNKSCLGILLKYLSKFMKQLSVSLECCSQWCLAWLCVLTKEHKDHLECQPWVERQTSLISISSRALFFTLRPLERHRCWKTKRFPLPFTWRTTVCFASPASTHLDERLSGASARTNLIGRASLDASRSDNIRRTAREMNPSETEQMRGTYDSSHVQRKNKWTHPLTENQKQCLS